jgi:hypothetical protein
MPERMLRLNFGSTPMIRALFCVGRRSTADPAARGTSREYFAVLRTGQPDLVFVYQPRRPARFGVHRRHLELLDQGLESVEFRPQSRGLGLAELQLVKNDYRIALSAKERQPLGGILRRERESARHRAHAASFRSGLARPATDTAQRVC